MATGAKLPFEWQRLSDDDKTKIIDSARTAAEKQRTAQRSQPDGGTGFQIIPGRVLGGPNFMVAPLAFVSIDQMPDYRRAFWQGAALGDADGNLWIRTSQMMNGGTVYDVISNTGELKDRILIPPGRIVAGFGPGVVVYWASP